ncbi:aldose 1-epimerase [Saccharibacillus sp. CPCC 101409]|uniref:aldose 1-epimerase n=1 Tax=Saccharibacillus sp. CPCC 101409 TaxID=3058041 RepID=UPI0026730103|nr:aldose 1-epimerase [Saccharibacillus sp. CPCC 101409]MDO3411700.1 aldose 1-epimerase [Saccharibacillus sp. CPCC 101409]
MSMNPNAGDRPVHEASRGDYNGEEAVWLKYGDYEAAVLPKIGGNLIAFRDIARGFRFLREPEEMQAFVENPGTHGIPPLFPPNRYDGGRLKWNGEEYKFPVNEEATGNFLHGYLHTLPWEVEGFGADESGSFVTVSHHVGEGHKMYEYFPYAFTLRIRYTLSSLGLEQSVTIFNESGRKFPALLAFHTALNAPFAEGGSSDDCRIKVTIGQRRELDDRMLPTGGFQPLTEWEEEMRESGSSPYADEMDNHYTAVPQGGRNRAEITDTRIGVKLVYDVGTSYRHWMIWNSKAGGKFICPEPQTNLVNAPNQSLPAEEMGLFAIEPGEVWQATSRIYAVDLASGV